MSKHVLVTYGSKRGGTAEIANVIADVLRRDGCVVDCKPADEVTSLAGYDAVIIGGALYMMRWHRDAWRFAVQHQERLRELPVWLFSSGPLDDSASAGDISPTGQVARLMTRLGARGHITFGGRLAPDAKGLIASAMAKKYSGDWRDWAQVRAWACELAAQIQLEESPRLPPRVAPAPRQPAALLALLAFVAVTAIAGGALLLARPDGSLLVAAGLLADSGFSSFVVPGFLLLFVIGGSNALAALLVAGERRLGSVAAFTAGTALIVWIVCEMTLLPFSWLQLVYAAVGCAILWLAVRAARAAAVATMDRTTAGRNNAFAA